MLEQFLNHLDAIGPVRRSHRFLLAVSGGMDSMVMLDVFLRANLSIAVAHCNFQLRPQEAAREEELVRNICRKHEISFFVEHFNTKEYAKAKNLSTQVAARELRYAYFNRLLEEHKIDWLATAHHLNDSFETTLLNLIRGTGLEGLQGIPRHNARTIRPILFATRSQIEQYALTNQVAFLQDSSNLMDDYSRNYLRNKVLPLLKEINPGLEHTFRSTSERMQQSYQVLEQRLRALEAESVSVEGDKILILKRLVLESGAPQLFLWELIKKYGFTFDQCSKILSTVQAGKQFSTHAFDLVNDRTRFILRARTERDIDFCTIDAETAMVSMNKETLEVEERSLKDVQIGTDTSIALLSSDKIEYPLRWRYWAPGDVFQPLGMDNHKKLSDFLIDRKVDRLSKENVSVLESKGEIIWVVGHRISEKAKITDETERVTVFRWYGYPSEEV